MTISYKDKDSDVSYFMVQAFMHIYINSQPILFKYTNSCYIQEQFSVSEFSLVQEIWLSAVEDSEKNLDFVLKQPIFWNVFIDQWQIEDLTDIFIAKVYCK